MPEEINRVVTDHVATLLFAPTQTAVQNLRNEGFGEDRIVFSGDVMLDNVRRYASIAIRKSECGIHDLGFVLATIHRDFNTDNPERLRNILSALNDIAEEFDADVVFPVHPRTRHCIDTKVGMVLSERVKQVNPMSYLETLGALNQARLVLTDSGGLQKEAFFCGKGCVILRPETEWVEIVDAGAAVLADADRQHIMDAAKKMMDANVCPPTQFGEGNAAEAVVERIVGK